MADDPINTPVASNSTVTDSGLIKAESGAFEITAPVAITIDIPAPKKDALVFVFKDGTGAGHTIVAYRAGSPDVPVRVTFDGKKGSSVKLTSKAGVWVPSELNGVGVG